jgi:hypothetical protein
MCVPKGFSGARMQEIADEAGINKAMLHYCFKKQQLLFGSSCSSTKCSPQINTILILMHPF